MKRQKNNNINEKHPGQQRILLVFLPFWTPYIPPQGITTLKSYLQQYGYKVKTADLTMVKELRDYYNNYMQILRSFIPYHKIGNFVNIGHDVMLNHMLAHVNHTVEKDYKELVKIIVYRTFYHTINKEQVEELIKIIADLYERLKVHLIKLVEEVKPTVFGSTAYSGTLASCLFAFKLVKERYPHIKTVVGGGSFSDHLMKDTPNFERFLNKARYIDKIFIGQGQVLFLKWLKGELPASQQVYTRDDINGEDLPITSPGDIPDLSDLNPSEYLYLAASGSRSCPYGCSFCNVKNFWGQHQLKDVKQLVSELRYLHDKYKCQLFFMYDALLNNHINNLSKELLASDFTVYFVGYLKACEAACDINKTLLWRRGGFYRARLGVESGSQKILDIMDKKITVRQIKETIKNLALAGIKTTAYWVIGHPGETEEDFQATLDIVEELKNYMWEAECNPFNYYYSGQHKQDEWASKRKLVYPEWAEDMLIAQTWTLNLEPSREEVYRRMNRFTQHCDKLGIPNPYSINDIFKADERWKRIHKNAVPSIAQLRDTNLYIDECKKVKDVVFTQSFLQDDGDFDL